jgi:hypothetical protein
MALLTKVHVSFRAQGLSKLALYSPNTLTHNGQVRLDSVRDQAFNAIRSGLNAENIVQELASSLTSKLVISLSRPLTNSHDIRYPEILQMHVQVLLQHITSVPVIQNLPSLIRRIVDSQLPHGGDIIIDLYQKFLLQSLRKRENGPTLFRDR